MKAGQNRKMYMGIGKFMIPIPLAISNSGLKKGVSGAESKAQLLTEEERRIHHFVVRKMASVEKPIRAELVADEIGLPVSEVENAIDKLESLKTFLYRSDGRAIDWAYPLSLDETGHRMTVDTGDQFNAA
jgi:hypothetical protein